MKKQCTRFVLVFKREIKFPRFTMHANEPWLVCEGWGTGRDYLDAVATGADRFDFAGGQCMVEDVERHAYDPEKWNI